MKNTNQLESFNDIKEMLLDMDFSELAQKINNYLQTINKMVNFSAKEIRKNRLKIDGYYFLLQEVEAIKVIAAKILDININYEPTEDDVKAELVKMKQTLLSRPNGEEVMRLTYTSEAIDVDFAIPLFLENWFYIDRAKETYLEQHKYYDVIKALDLIKHNIRTHINNDCAERELIKSIERYKPTKEHRLESYFTCDNYEVLKSILMQDVRGKKGVQLSIVLRALSDAGCTRKGGVKPLLENILKPIYGAEGTHQSLSDALKNVNDTQTMEAIKHRAEMYKKRLQ